MELVGDRGIIGMFGVVVSPEQCHAAAQSSNHSIRSFIFRERGSCSRLERPPKDEAACHTATESTHFVAGSADYYW